MQCPDCDRSFAGDIPLDHLVPDKSQFCTYGEDFEGGSVCPACGKKFRGYLPMNHLVPGTSQVCSYRENFVEGHVCPACEEMGATFCRCDEPEEGYPFPYSL